MALSRRAGWRGAPVVCNDVGRNRALYATADPSVAAYGLTAGERTRIDAPRRVPKLPSEGEEAVSLDEALVAWRKALGNDAVIDGEIAPSSYRECTSGATRSVLAVLRPASVAEVVQTVEIAARFRLPLHAISTGHDWGYGTALAVANQFVRSGPFAHVRHP